MSRSRSIRFRRSSRKVAQDFEINITSLLDVMVIILVFLLKSYMASTMLFTPAKGVQLPISASPDDPKDANMLAITPEGIFLENERVVEFIQTAEEVGDKANYTFRESDLSGQTIVPLYDALVKLRTRSEMIKENSPTRVEGRPVPFRGSLAIQADKLVSYRILQKVMTTAGEAEFTVFRFLAVKRET